MATVKCDKCKKDIGPQNILWICSTCGARYCHGISCGQGGSCKNWPCTGKLVRTR